MQADIDRVLISQDRIARRVKELAGQITADYAKSDGQSAGGITIVPVMTGALVFCGDLIRQMPIAMKIGLIMVSSYPGASVKAQNTQVLAQRLGDLRGRTVLLIDDILDSGGRSIGLSANYDRRDGVVRAAVPNGTWTIEAHAYGRTYE